MRVETLLASVLLFVPNSAYANGKDEAAALANCAWSQVSESADTLLSVKPVKHGFYDNISLYEPIASEPVFGALMRVYAACPREKNRLDAAKGENKVSHKFLNSLKKVKPEDIPADNFATEVFRCEAHFPDHDDGIPSLIWWGYGSDKTKSQLGQVRRVYNGLADISAEEVNALINAKSGTRKLRELLVTASGEEVIEVDTYAAGLASGKAFQIRIGAVNAECMSVKRTGALADA